MPCDKCIRAAVSVPYGNIRSLALLNIVAAR